MALGNLTDLCLITWTWFLMISGNPSSKCQRVWLQIRPTVDTSICTELKGLISKWGMMSPAAWSSRIFVRKTSSLQVSGRGFHYFLGGPLANFFGNLYNFNVVFKGMKVRTPCLHSDPYMLPLLKLSSHTYVFFTLCLNHFTRLYRVCT